MPIHVTAILSCFMVISLLNRLDFIDTIVLHSTTLALILGGKNALKLTFTRKRVSINHAKVTRGFRQFPTITFR